MQEETGAPWWRAEPVLDGPGCQEALAFRIRRGGAPENIVAEYEHAFSRERADELAAQGHTFIEVTFFKGMGIEYERAEWERSKRFLRRLRKHGVRTGVYTQWGSFFTETFFREIPEAREWVQVGVDGRPIEYGDPPNQYFRWRGCPGNPAFLEFIERVIRIAVEAIEVDAVYFDNLCLFEGHDTLCYCSHCRCGFREYLARKYPSEEDLFERMGLRSVEHVEPPRFRPWTDYTLRAEAIRDPLVQEFVDFRCEQFADAWHATYEYLRRLNPDVALMGNPSFPRKYNERLTSAIDMWRLRRTPALYYMENAVRNVGEREGVVVSNARGYRYGRVLDKVMVCCGGEKEPALSYCECLAFQHGSGGKMTEAARPYRAFFDEHRDEFYANVTPAADVGVLRHDGSLTLRWHDSYAVMELAQQALLCAGIPWMPVWGQQLIEDTPLPYRVLVIPGCGCLSAAETEAVAAFVRQGGGVVILENAGCFNEHHRTLDTWRFAPLFASVVPAGGFAMRYRDRGCTPEFEHQNAPLFAEHGAGRVAYLPRIRRTRDPIRTYAEMGGYDGMEHLDLPRGWKALPDAVVRVAGAPFAVRVKGPRSLLSEAFTREERTLVHLVNYAHRRVPAGAEVLVAGTAGRTADLYTPGERTRSRTIDATRGARDMGVFSLPTFLRYALLVVKNGK